MHFEVYQDDKQEWRWRLRGGNGEILAQGESYKNKEDCYGAIALMKESASAIVKDVAG